MSINDANGNLHSDTDGRFTDKTGTRPAGTLAAARSVLPEAPDCANGGTQWGVTVTETPVSDRERNYYLTFDRPGAYISVNPFEFGTANLDTIDTFVEGERVFIGVTDTASGCAISDGNMLQVQYSLPFTYDAQGDDDDPMTQLDEGTRIGIEEEIRERLREEFGPTTGIEFSSNGEA